MVRYYSTRGAVTEGVPFSEALLTGLAPDGGLFVPDRIPELPRALPVEDFPALAHGVLLPWVDASFPDAVLADVLQDALNFPVPLVPLSGAGWEGVYVLELFHGPTLSFKDVGARTMARLMGHLVRQRGEELTILVATSGDTGSAVADGFAGQEGIRVVLLYPAGKVSPLQELQLTVRRPGVETYAVAGTFDDCQRMVKGAFVHPDLQGMRLSSANSINIGRLLPQMLYYIQAGLQQDAPPVFVVPSGNLGNLTGGVLAWLGGLPVRYFVAAHNANDFFPRYLQGEDVHPGPSRRTFSNAMDVGAPSNFERLVHLLGPVRLRAHVRGYSVSDADTLTRMRRLYEETGYLADPHTAVGLEVVRRMREEGEQHVPIVVLSTAHPAKFPEIVARALSEVTPEAEALERLKTRPRDAKPLEASTEALVQVLRSSEARLQM